MQFESLELRQMMAINLFVDYGFGFQGGQLTVTDAQMDAPNIFGPGAADGEPTFGKGHTLISLEQSVRNQMIDLTGDGLANRADAELLAARVTVELWRIFEPFGVNIVGATARNLDDVSAALAGSASHDVYMLAVGDRPPSDDSIWGIAVQDIGNLKDGTACTFVDAILRDSEPDEWVHAIASTIAHEAGHSIGLQHTHEAIPLTAGDVMRTLASDHEGVHLFYRFPVALAETTGLQNSFQTLASSGHVGVRGPSSPAYVTGTGLNDRITITPRNSTTATVTVEPFWDSNWTNSAYTAFSYVVNTGNGITVEGGLGDDVLLLQGDVRAKVNFRGGGGNDTAQVYASGIAVQVTDTKITYGATMLSYADYNEVERLYVGGDHSATSVTVVSTAAGDSLDIVGAKYVTLGTGRTSLLRGNLNVQYLRNSMYLTVNDSLETAARGISLSSVSLDGLTTSPIIFAQARLAGLTVHAGKGGNGFYVFDTPAIAALYGTYQVILNTGTGSDIVSIDRTSTGVQINGQAGEDNVTAGGRTRSGPGSGPRVKPLQLGGGLDVTNASGKTELVLDDSGGAAGRFIEMNVVNGRGFVFGLVPGAAVTYYATQTSLLDLRASHFDNTFIVHDTATNRQRHPYLSRYFEKTATRITTGYGNDLVYVYATSGPLDVDLQFGSNTVFVSWLNQLGTIKGALNVHGAGGSNSLLLEDGANTTAGQAVMFGRDYVYRAGAAFISFHDLNYLEYYGGSGGNQIVVEDTLQNVGWGYPGGTAIYAGSGRDDVIVNQTTGELQVNLQSGDGDTVTVGSAAGSLDTIQGRVSLNGWGTGQHVIVNDWANADDDLVEIGSSIWRRGASEIVLDGWTPAMLTYYAGTGSETINFLSTPAGLTLLYAGEGYDTVLFHPGMAGDNFAIADGGTGDDTFAFEDGVAFLGYVDGGEGSNTLDYSRYTTGIVVNLPLATATGVYTLFNIQNAIGGSGADLLVGNGLGNIFWGGGGRDLLIAGGGAAVLFGGDDDDLLIGGSTAYDNDLATLDAVLADWQSPDDYATRMQRLFDGTELYPPLNEGTVGSNGGGNVLYGDAGLDLLFGSLDWDWNDLEVEEQFRSV